MARDGDSHRNDLGADSAAGGRATTLRLELPEAVMQQLRVLAQRQGQSVPAEAVRLLRDALSAGHATAAPRAAARQDRLVKSAGLHVELPDELVVPLRRMAEHGHRSLGAQTAQLLQAAIQRAAAGEGPT